MDRWPRIWRRHDGRAGISSSVGCCCRRTLLGRIRCIFLTLLIVFIISAREYDLRTRRLGPLIVMAIGLATFGVGVAWYFWPMHSHSPEAIAATPPATQPKPPWKHSLEELYASDFPGLFSMERALTVSDPGSPNTTLEIRFRLYQDFRSNTEFINFHSSIAQYTHRR